MDVNEANKNFYSETFLTNHYFQFVKMSPSKDM